MLESIVATLWSNLFLSFRLLNRNRIQLGYSLGLLSMQSPRSRLFACGIPRLGNRDRSNRALVVSKLIVLQILFYRNSDEEAEASHRSGRFPIYI